MVQTDLKRGHGDSVYFATVDTSTYLTSIRKLQFNPKFRKGIVNQLVYDLNSRIVAFEPKNYTDQIAAGVRTNGE